jgi:AcrR family transcriptional regulator
MFLGQFRKGVVVASSQIGSKDPEERRRRILAATIEVVRERGFAGTRVLDISAAAGTSPGLVLYHFGSLAGALAEALTFAEDTYYADLTGTSAPPAVRSSACG